MNLSFDITLAAILTMVGVLGAAVARTNDAGGGIVLAFSVLALLSLGWLVAAWMRFRRTG